MKRACLVVAVLAASGLCACTGGSKGGSAAGGEATSPPSSPRPAVAAGPTPVLSDVAALKVQSAYEKAIAAAALKRNTTATRKLQTGPLLTTSLADYRWTKGVHKKAFKAVKLTSPTNLLPVTTTGAGWFLSTSYDGGPAGPAYASLFQRSHPGAPWRKSLEIWLGNRQLDDPVLVSGVAQLPDAHGRAQDRAALKSLEAYLDTGKRPKKLTDLGPMTYTRKDLYKSEVELKKGATATLKCSQPAGSVTEAVRTSVGTDVVASLQCTITKHARPNWTLYLKNQWKALSNRSTNLRAFTVREIVQVAMTVTRHDGTAQAVGVTWEAVAVTAS